MIRVKHLFDDVEPDDGLRVWVEPIGLTRDLAEWCAVDFIIPQIGPPKALWEWFEAHPEGYSRFRERYHETLMGQAASPLLQQLAQIANQGNLTLLHQGDHPACNSAIALYEVLTVLRGVAPQEP